MALKFHPTNISALLIGRGFVASGIGASSAITVYAGVQPTAAEIQANWSQYNSVSIAPAFDEFQMISGVGQPITGEWGTDPQLLCDAAAKSELGSTVHGVYEYSGPGQCSVLDSSNTSVGTTYYTNTRTTPASSNFLGHFTGAVWSQPSSLIASITTFPAAVQASNSGTATWCIIWTTNPALSAMGSTTIPTTSFIVGPVSSLAGTGLVRFDSVAFTAGTSISILDGLITTTAL